MIFLLVILKIPIVYLCAVIWWAIKAERRAGGARGARPGAAIPSSAARWQPPSGRVAAGPRGPQRRPGPRAPARGVRPPVSSVPEPADRFSVTDAIAGLMAAGSILLSFIAAGLRAHPRGRAAPGAARTGCRGDRRARRGADERPLPAPRVRRRDRGDDRLDVGMTLAVITENPII